MDISNIWQYPLRKGPTDHPRNGACLFDAGMWLVYGRIGDNPPCSCPVIRAYAIGLNDRMPDDVRQRLRPFILRVVGNRDPAAEGKRLHFIVVQTARRVVPLVFDQHFPSLATRMRNLDSNASLGKIRELMAAAVNAAAYATYAAVNSIGVANAWDEAINILDGALRIGRQSREFDEAEVRASVAAFERAQCLDPS